LNALLVLAAAGAVSWLLRVAFITVFPARKLPKWLRDTLEAAAPAAIAGLLATDLTHRGVADTSIIPALFVGTAVAVAVTWWFKNLALTAIAGIAVYGSAAAVL
jgi:branched-subunit amino acid transport protein